VLQLRPDVIKLDRSLVAGIDHDPARRALVASIVSLAHELRATVIAEGVETAADLTVLATNGVDAAQGFLFAAPDVDPHRWQDWRRQAWPIALADPERGTQQRELAAQPQGRG
jgi:EAL domain-containing protein (putative c-di-GMP-specific phosphodiesterase class I)